MEKKKSNKFDQRRIENLLKTENKFITNIFSVLAVPQNSQNGEELDIDASFENPPLVTTKTTRATSLVELQNRINKLKYKNNSYKEKLQKKNLKNRLKKKIKAEKRNTIPKKKSTELNTKSNKVKEINVNTEIQPVFNKDDKMVYSKIAFTNFGKEMPKRTVTNPRKILEQVVEVNNKIDSLKKAGKISKAIEIKEKNIWKNALAKSQGIKVKDNPVLLKKSIQRQEQKVRSSKKKWENRIQGVEKAKEEKQKRRQENIQKHKKEKKLHKLKKAAKKGKIVAGF